MLTKLTAETTGQGKVVKNRFQQGNKHKQAGDHVGCINPEVCQIYLEEKTDVNSSIITFILLYFSYYY